MKKDKAWLKTEIVKLPNASNKHTVISLGDAIRLVNKLDEPKKVTIPQIVVDWLESCKGWDEEAQRYYEEDAVKLVSAMDGDNAGMTHNVEQWLYEARNGELFARAWLDGYEVEKEKLYYVLTSEDKTMLQRNVHRQLVQSRGINLSEAGRYHRLTEREIKDYDERYWPFAVEVAE